MQYIRKNNPPREFIEWKALENDDWKPDWDDNFQAPEKNIVHDSLLAEQGFICCYCGKSIKKTNSHVEHLKPRSQYPDLALDYQNLLASCQGERQENEIPSIPIHCGHKKGNWYDEQLMVSPLNLDCSNFFRYTLDGQIRATQDPNQENITRVTIEKLGLSIDKLNRLRLEAIQDTLADIDSLTIEQIQQLIQGYENRNTKSEYRKFCFVIIYILRQELRIR